MDAEEIVFAGAITGLAAAAAVEITDQEIPVAAAEITGRGIPVAAEITDQGLPAAAEITGRAIPAAASVQTTTAMDAAAETTIPAITAVTAVTIIPAITAVTAATIIPAITTNKQIIYNTFQTEGLFLTNLQASTETIEIIIAVATPCNAPIILKLIPHAAKTNDTTYNKVTKTIVQKDILLMLQTELEELLVVVFVVVFVVFLFAIKYTLLTKLFYIPLNKLSNNYINLYLYFFNKRLNNYY